MDKHRLELHLGVALKHSQIRKACAAIERLRSAIGLLHGLSPGTLSILKAYVIKECLPKKGADHQFAEGYLRLVEKELEDGKREERRLFYGLTGAEDLEANILPPNPPEGKA